MRENFEDNRPRTRIHKEKQSLILEAALDVFSAYGFRGSTLDQIADAAGMSKPNLLYYFKNKEDIHAPILKRILDTWLEPLRQFSANGDPYAEIEHYLHRKLEMTRTYPRESRLFASEMLRGAPEFAHVLHTDLHELMREKAQIIQGWVDQEKIAPIDPYHLIFSIWATTQHYADFDIQVRAVLGEEVSEEECFAQAKRSLDILFFNGLRPYPKTAASSLHDDGKEQPQQV